MLRALLPWGSGRAFAVSGTGQLISGRGCITAFSARNTSSTTAAELTVYDGGSANGRVLFDVGLAANASQTLPWVPHALPYEEGLWLVTDSGAAVGSVTVYADHDCRRWLWLAHKTEELTGAEALAALAGVH
jgi:hypothetical protein